jgi:CheY-like chemotaxis protein
MPEMDGYEATAEIRSREGPNRQATIIAMTADVMKGSPERCLQPGMNFFIPKPVKLDDLIKVVQQAVNRKEVQARAAPSSGVFDASSDDSHLMNVTKRVELRH